MKIQSNKSWYKAISNVNPIFYNPLSIILHNNPPRIYQVRPYIGPRESARTFVINLAVKYNVQQYCVTSRSFGNLSEKYQSTKQPQR